MIRAIQGYYAGSCRGGAIIVDIMFRPIRLLFIQLNLNYIIDWQIKSKDMQANSGKVLVTGASGYIASHLIHQLLQKGYHVVGTVRSLANKDKYSFLLDFPNASTHLELKQADLLKPETWITATEGIENVFHVASPIPPHIPKDENQLIKPAVEGTLSVIEACLKNSIKKLIFVSSCLTIMVRTDGKIPCEEDWSQANLLHHYPKSKYLAEKAFWDQAEKNGDKLEFISALPSLVLGPAFTKHGNSSQAFVCDILNGGFPGIPTPSPEFSTVDVRDLAVGLIKVLQYPKANGKRWIISGQRIKAEQVFSIIRQKYTPLGYKIPDNHIDAEGIKASGHGPSMRTLFLLGKKFQVNNKRSNEELGLTFRSAKEAVLDQAQKQIQLGIVQKKF